MYETQVKINGYIDRKVNGKAHSEMMICISLKMSTHWHNTLTKTNWI